VIRHAFASSILTLYEHTGSIIVRFVQLVFSTSPFPAPHNLVDSIYPHSPVYNSTPRAFGRIVSIDTPPLHQWGMEFGLALGPWTGWKRGSARNNDTFVAQDTVRSTAVRHCPAGPAQLSLERIRIASNSWQLRADGVLVMVLC
jgi:hypothetical protein